MRVTRLFLAVAGGGPVLGAVLAALVPTTMTMAPDPAWRHTAALASERESAVTFFVEAPPQDLDPSIATMQERVVARRLAEMAAADYRPIGFDAYEVPAPAPLPPAPLPPAIAEAAGRQDGPRPEQGARPAREFAASDGAIAVATYEEVGDPQEPLAGG